jgi:hypothetical protein
METLGDYKGLAGLFVAGITGASLRCRKLFFNNDKCKMMDHPRESS